MAAPARESTTRQSHDRAPAGAIDADRMQACGGGHDDMGLNHPRVGQQARDAFVMPPAGAIAMSRRAPQHGRERRCRG